MKKGQLAILLTLTVFLVSTPFTTALAQALIKDIRFDASTSTVDRIIFELSGPYLPTGKALPGSNPRVYFDFPEAAPAPKVKNRIDTNGNYIKQIRHAYHKTPNPKTRVVFDLVDNKKMDFEQDFDKATNTLTISLYPAGAKPEQAVSPQPTSEPVVAAKPAPPQPSQTNVGKKVQPMAEVTIAPKPKPEKVTPPPPPPKPQPEVAAKKEPIAEKPPVPKTQAAVPKPKPAPVPEAKPEPGPQPKSEPVAQPKPEPVPEAKPEPAPQPEAPQVATIPPSEKVPDTLSISPKEATDIQPMAEVGATKQESIDATPVLYTIDFDPKSKRGETISFKLNGFHPPVVFGIEEDIPRIVCFFKNAAAGKQLRDVIGTGGQHVRTIKIGKYQNPDNIRVVLELTPGYNYDLQQVFFKDDNVFMLIINKAGKQAQSKNT